MNFLMSHLYRVFNVTHNKAMNHRAFHALDLATLGRLWQRYLSQMKPGGYEKI